MAINIARRKVIAALGGTAVAWPLTWPRAACARQPERMRRNGVLMPFSADDQEVTAVDPSEAAAPPDKRLSPGDVIVEVQYQSVGNPADLPRRPTQGAGRESGGAPRLQRRRRDPLRGAELAVTRGRAAK